MRLACGGGGGMLWRVESVKTPTRRVANARAVLEHADIALVLHAAVIDSWQACLAFFGRRWAAADGARAGGLARGL